MAVVHDFICPPEFEPEEVNPDDPSQIIGDFEDENIELWMIKAPFNFDVSLLSGHELKNHFNIPSNDKSDTEYVVVATENHPMHKSLQAVVPHKSKNKLKIGPSFKGYIDVVQSVSIPKCDNPTLPQEKTYHIPSNLKQRYIPYGSRSPPRISSSEIVKTKSKKRKRSSKLLSLPMSDFDASQVSQMESEELHLKKKRKKNKEKDLDESTVSVGEMACSGSALSFQASEAVSESYLPSSVTMEEVCSEKKKKRKRSRDSLEQNLLKSVEGETPKLKEFYTPHCDEELTPVREKKKRKKNRDEIDETFFENLQGLGNTDSSKTHTMSEEKKKKKHKFEKEKEEKKIENVDENKTAGELAKKDSGFGSLEMEFDHLNSLDSMPEQKVSSSHKKKHKKKSHSENSLDETYSQLNIPITNDENKTEHVNQDVMASSSHKKKRKKKSLSGNSSDETNTQLNIPITNEEEKNIDDVIQNEMVSFMDTAVELSKQDRDNKTLEITHVNSQDSVPEQTVSSSRKKKKKKKKNSLSENSLDETYSQLNIPITNEDEKNIEDGNQDVIASSMDTTGELARKMVGNGSLQFTHLNSQDSVPEQTVSSSRKKKKKNKKNSLSENSLDETYSQLNIPITNEDEKNIEDGNQDVIASSMDTTGELARKKLDNGSLQFTHLNSQDSVPEQTVSSSRKKKKKHKKNSLSENSLDETYSQLNIPITNDEVKNIEDGNHNKRFVSIDTTEVLAKKETVIDSFQLEPRDLNSENSVPEESISSSHKKKKHKKKSHLENSLDETYSQMNIPITNDEEKNIEDGNQDVITSSMDTTGELARKKLDNGSLEFTHLNSQDSVPEQTVSSSRKKKKKHKKNSLSENSLDETYSQLNIPITNDEEKNIEDGNQYVITSSMDTKEELPKKKVDNGSLEFTHLNSQDSVPEQTVSSSRKKKHKKNSLSENSLDETYSQLNIPITNDEVKNIEDGNHNKRFVSIDTTEVLAKKETVIDSFQLEPRDLNSENSVPEESISSSHKKKKHKKKSHLENSLDETYSQMNIPITNDEEKNIEDGNQDVIASSMDTTGELARKKLDNGSLEFTHLNSQDSVPEQTVSSSRKKKKKNKKNSLSENSLDETYSQLNIQITNDEEKNIEDGNQYVITSSMDTKEELAKKKVDNGSLEFTHLNSQDSVPEQMVSSSRKKKKKNKKNSLSENSLDETYSQLNVPITNEDEKNIEDANQDVIASSMDTTGELARKKLDNGSFQFTHLNSQDSVPEQTVSSSRKKKHKKKSLSENSLDETYSQLNIPITKEDMKIVGQPVSSSHEKKNQYKKMSHLENSLDKTYLQLTIPITNDEVKNIEDGNHNEMAISMVTPGILTKKNSVIGYFKLKPGNLNSENLVPEDPILSSHKKKKKKSLSKDFFR